ncbi:MAG: hypothetical protein PHY13_07165 [Clostridia bacterium]|jgi:hypothetical protein|nr:hypothetical protein [Clostridia bacterium]MDD3972855.1 hypothetical protein [Clostridia bacterium]MDD4543532.1 hypothetical protein [Clostridia bacterium]NLF37360.1 hypothetical protein [Clostridiaceae bacterium]
MAINRKCPKCGGMRVQMTNERSKHGCLFTILFGVYYLFLVLFKWIIGLCVFICYDWWMAIIKATSNKGHVWQSRKWFSGNKRAFYCHDCGYNFKA